MSKRTNKIAERVLANTAKPEYRNSVRAVNLSGYEVPKIREVHGKDWVQWGEKNDYYKKLIESYLGSPTNARCINGIVDMIFGRGLQATDSDEKPEMFVKMKTLLKKRELRRVCNDYKMLGSAAMQIVYNKSKTEIVKVTHFPMETLRAEKAKGGMINAYYYHPDWLAYKPSDKPKRIPTFGNGAKGEQIEIYVFKPYRSGFYYHTPVDYHGCLQYCQLEEEVSNYHINNIKNGLQPSLLINFNNGIPNEETQQLIENKIVDKFGGSSNSGKFILTFNDDAESKADVNPIHLPDAHAQYQFLADESREKIMLGHGIVSPILLGIKDNTGFGNNAEELRTASVLMDNIVIRPFQQAVIDGLEEILGFNKIYLQLYFVTLQPIEFSELENVGTKIRREEETGEKLSSDVDQEVKMDFDDEEGDNLLSQLEGLGECLGDDWEIVHSEVVKDADMDFKLAETLAKANPNKESSQDKGIFKVRYAYVPVRKSADSRKFCKHMETFTEGKVVFRKEDINQMSFKGVNRELGHNKQNYSLFKYKGGVNCHHHWELRVYKKKVDGGSGEDINKAMEEGYKNPINPSEVPIAPKDMKDGGRYPSTK